MMVSSIDNDQPQICNVVDASYTITRRRRRRPLLCSSCNTTTTSLSIFSKIAMITAASYALLLCTSHQDVLAHSSENRVIESHNNLLETLELEQTKRIIQSSFRADKGIEVQHSNNMMQLNMPTRFLRDTHQYSSDNAKRRMQRRGDDTIAQAAPGSNNNNNNGYDAYGVPPTSNTAASETNNNDNNNDTNNVAPGGLARNNHLTILLQIRMMHMVRILGTVIVLLLVRMEVMDQLLEVLAVIVIMEVMEHRHLLLPMEHRHLLLLMEHLPHLPTEHHHLLLPTEHPPLLRTEHLQDPHPHTVEVPIPAHGVQEVHHPHRNGEAIPATISEEEMVL
mmetsp:Transcript_28216/g.47887  ORF Transcript_28216/g.47887 Transcript_28216/m.47887 type:complete len:336 (+) Transcript_28216:148-1155(+)